MVNIKLIFEKCSNELKVKEGRLEEPEERLVRILAMTALYILIYMHIGLTILKSRSTLLLSIY
jgi:hypothetical protein